MWNDGYLAQAQRNGPIPRLQLVEEGRIQPGLGVMVTDY